MYDIGEFGFDFAIGIRSVVEQKYGKLIVEHVTQNRVYNQTTNSTVIQMDIKALQMVYCGVDNFSYEDKQEIYFKGVDKFLCVKDKSFLTVGGAFLSKQYKFLLIRFEICNNSTFNNSCASGDDIRMWFTKNEIAIRFVNAYFDYTDFDKPVKKFIDDRFYLPLKHIHKKIANVFIKRSYTVLYDSLNPLDKPKNLTFVKVDNIQQLESELDWQYPGNLQVNIRLDPEFDIYSRQIYSFYNLMFQLGGTYNALLLIGTLLTKFIVIKLLYLDIIQELFYNKKKDSLGKQNKNKKESFNANDTTKSKLFKNEEQLSANVESKTRIVVFKQIQSLLCYQQLQRQQSQLCHLTQLRIKGLEY
eukprot:403360411